jgi:hypothetical protein
MSDLSLAQHTGLAFLIAQHTNEQVAQDATKVEETVIGSQAAEKLRASKKSAKSGAQVTPIHDKPAVFGVALPERNTLDAKGFLFAVRDAGKRGFEATNEVTGEVRITVKVDQGKVRDDIIRAIHAYCGYDTRRNFGSQDIEARAKAQRELRGGVAPGPTREEQRAAARTMLGFVAGMPDDTARFLQNLLAREVTSAEALIQHEKDAADPKRSTADRLLSKGLAEVEQDRLTHIRADIKRFG